MKTQKVSLWPFILDSKNNQNKLMIYEHTNKTKSVKA